MFARNVEWDFCDFQTLWSFLLRFNLQGIVGLFFATGLNCDLFNLKGSFGVYSSSLNKEVFPTVTFQGCKLLAKKIVWASQK